VLCIAFVADATSTSWRSGALDGRRRAAIVGGGMLAFASIAVLHSQLVIWGFVSFPMVITPAFVLMLLVMGFELGRDIFRAGRLARDFAESERHLELAAHAARLGLWTWDAGARRAWATDTARAIFGLARGETIDVGRLISLIHLDDVPRVREAVRGALSMEGEYSVQFRVCPPSGSTRWIAARGSSQTGAFGRAFLVRGVLRDVTDQKQVEDEADELRRELAHAGRVTVLGQLASALAHELRQPLGAILRNAEAAGIILQKASPDLHELRAIVADIHADDRRAGEVIDRLRALLRRRQMEFQPIVLGSLLQDVSSLVRFDAAARHVTLDVAVGASLPPVSGDRVHLSQVLTNLILNGMDAMTESSDPRRRVIIEARSGANRFVEVAVTDSGSGIPPESMQRIFEPFFTTKAGGMGMGLCVSRTIIEAHGGRLWAENNVHGGATFRFELPAAEGTHR
jgi:two-component system sensor kinase FixL